MGCPEDMEVALKVTVYTAGRCVRRRVRLQGAGFEDVQAVLREWVLPQEAFDVGYVDEEGDFITMSLPEEWPECLDQMQRTQNRVVKLAVGVGMDSAQLAGLALGAGAPPEPGPPQAAAKDERDQRRAARHARRLQREVDKVARLQEQEKRRATRTQRVAQKRWLFGEWLKCALGLEGCPAGAAQEAWYHSLSADGEKMPAAAAALLRPVAVSEEKKTFAADRMSLYNYVHAEGLKKLADRNGTAGVRDAARCFRLATKIHPKSGVAEYNRACCEALMARALSGGGAQKGKSRQYATHEAAALAHLKAAVANGYRNADHLAGDADLACLRHHPKFARCLQKARQGKGARSSEEIRQRHFVVDISLDAGAAAAAQVVLDVVSSDEPEAPAGGGKRVTVMSDEDVAKEAGDRDDNDNDNEDFDDVDENCGSDDEEEDAATTTTAVDTTLDTDKGADTTLDTTLDNSVAMAAEEGPWSAELQLLAQMGFEDAARSRQLLEKHCGDLQAVTTDLLA